MRTHIFFLLRARSHASALLARSNCSIPCASSDTNKLVLVILIMGTLKFVKVLLRASGPVRRDEGGARNRRGRRQHGSIVREELQHDVACVKSAGGAPTRPEMRAR